MLWLDDKVNLCTDRRTAERKGRRDLFFDFSQWHPIGETWCLIQQDMATERQYVFVKLQWQRFSKHIFKYVVIFLTWHKLYICAESSAAGAWTHTHTRKLNHNRIINEIHEGSFITRFKIPSSWGKTNPFEIITHALLGVHKSNYAERRGGTERTSTADKLVH